MTLRIRSTRRCTALAVLTVFVTSCGGTTESAATSTVASADTVAPVTEVVTQTGSTEPTSAPTGAPDTTTVPGATAAPDTAAPDTAAPDTAAAPEVVDLTLRPDGIGGLVFGAATPAELVAALSPALGAPTTFESLTYPDAQDPSVPFYENDLEERGFAFPFGTDICFGNGLCTYFGGPSADAVVLVGFDQAEGPGSLTTAAGVTAGSQGADFPDAIVAQPGGCYSSGAGSADGVPILLQSTGEPFGYVDEATEEYIVQTPDVADLVVLSVFAGEEPYDMYGDC